MWGGGNRKRSASSSKEKNINAFGDGKLFITISPPHPHLSTNSLSEPGKTFCQNWGIFPKALFAKVLSPSLHTHTNTKVALTFPNFRQRFLAKDGFFQKLNPERK
uniref:Uncharacterized protein n=1 Tax=Micrurus carvalhoi TaxID=3147026 RepID=A0A2H6NMP4_9SAUR